MITRSHEFPGDPVFGDLFDDWSLTTPKIPPVDVSENQDAYVLEAELPGYTENEVKLNVEKHVLHLSSEKKSAECKDRKFLVRERFCKGFERSFILPEDVNEEAISARFDNGMLSITIPKVPVEASKKIQVRIQQ